MRESHCVCLSFVAGALPMNGVVGEEKESFYPCNSVTQFVGFVHCEVVLCLAFHTGGFGRKSLCSGHL
jgi:hypothetical protein